jgi:hypothetical protein
MVDERFSPLGDFNKGYAIVATIVSALSVISLVQKYLSVGLAPIAAEFFS